MVYSVGTAMPGEYISSEGTGDLQSDHGRRRLPLCCPGGRGIPEKHCGLVSRSIGAQVALSYTAFSGLWDSISPSKDM